jgi:hypothetical protein
MASLCEAKGNKENKETQNEMFLAFQNLIDFYCPSFLIERKKNKKTLFAIGTLLGVQKEKKRSTKGCATPFPLNRTSNGATKATHKDIKIYTEQEPSCDFVVTKQEKNKK